MLDRYGYIDARSQSSSYTLLLYRDAEREAIASTTGVVDSVVDSVVNGEGHTLVSPSSTEGVTTEDNSVEEVESPSETTGSISSPFRGTVESYRCFLACFS